MSNLSRRRFIATSAAVGATAFNFGCADNGEPNGNGSTQTASTNLKPMGANETVNVAIVGFRSRGAGHINDFRKMKNVRVAALCDVDQKTLDRESKKFVERNEKVETYVDYRKLLENKDIHAVVLATPNHWHALGAIWACQAGKDVYVEKPVSHSIWEGRKIVEAARKYGQMVQAGTQRRSDNGFKEAVEFIQKGNLGKIVLARGLCYKERPSIGKVDKPTPIPDHINYDLWSGPREPVPLMRKNLHYDWHWVWPTGNGDIGNQGPHEMDQCRWVIGEQKMAPRVFSWGGRFGYDDDATTANTQFAWLDYRPVPILFEVRGLPRKAGEEKPVMDVYKPGDVRIGIIIHCEGGYYAGGETGGWAYDNDGKKIKQFAQKSEGHGDNFIKAVRSRKVSDLNCDIEVGHTSNSLNHLANISYRLGKEASPGDVAEANKGNKYLADALERFQAHMAANNVDLNKTPITLGPTLNFDPKKERFTGDHAEHANALLKDPYRKGFEVPEKV